MKALSLGLLTLLAKTGDARAEADALLTQATTPSEPVDIGAMCYEPMEIEPWRADYVCPLDGERSTWSVGQGGVTNATLSLLISELPAASRQVESLRAAGLDVVLDASRFCRKCHPEVTAPQLELKVTIPGKPVHSTLGVSLGDLTTLQGFLASREQLKPEQLARVQVLLGIDPATWPPKVNP